MSDKKFANLHYPGIKANPNEGKNAINSLAQWRFESQIVCVGEEAQRKLLESSILLISANPLSTRITKKLVEFGCGRVGMLGSEILAGSHGLLPASENPEESKVSLSLSKWFKENAPWADFESFSNISLDRQYDDIAKGFDVVISANGSVPELEPSELNAKQVMQYICAASECGGWWISSSFCLNCIKAAVPRVDSQSSFFFPILDLLASEVAGHCVGTILASLGFADQNKVTAASRFKIEVEKQASCKKCQ